MDFAFLTVLDYVATEAIIQVLDHVCSYPAHAPLLALTHSSYAELLKCARIHLSFAGQSCLLRRSHDGVVMLGGRNQSKAGVHRLGRDPYRPHRKAVRDLFLSISIWWHCGDRRRIHDPIQVEPRPPMGEAWIQAARR